MNTEIFDGQVRLRLAAGLAAASVVAVLSGLFWYGFGGVPLV